MSIHLWLYGRQCTSSWYVRTNTALSVNARIQDLYISVEVHM